MGPFGVLLFDEEREEELEAEEEDEFLLPVDSFSAVKFPLTLLSREYSD